LQQNIIHRFPTGGRGPQEGLSELCGGSRHILKCFEQINVLNFYLFKIYTMTSSSLIHECFCIILNNYVISNKCLHWDYFTLVRITAAAESPSTRVTRHRRTQTKRSSSGYNVLPKDALVLLISVVDRESY